MQPFKSFKNILLIIIVLAYLAVAVWMSFTFFSGFRDVAGFIFAAIFSLLFILWCYDYTFDVFKKNNPSQ